MTGFTGEVVYIFVAPDASTGTRLEYENIYALGPGDSLTYDADAPNGVESVVELPVSYLCVHADRRDS